MQSISFASGGDPVSTQITDITFKKYLKFDFKNTKFVKDV